MNKIIIGGISAAVIIGIAAAFALMPSQPNSNQSTNEKLGLVINTPLTTTTLPELDEIYSQAASTGIGRSNVYMFWDIIEPEKGQFDWKQSDIIMSFNKKNNLKVTLYFSIVNGKTLGPFPDWIGKPSLITVSEDNVVNVLDAVLSRYDIIDTLIISGDTDEHFRYKEGEIPIYRDLFNNVYDRIKEKHPDVKIGNSFALHNVLNKNIENVVKELSIGDFVAFSYFPVDALNEIVKTPYQARTDLDKAFELAQNKQVALFEISWSTSSHVEGNEFDQTQFVNQVYEFFNENENQIEFVTWYRMYDRPDGSCIINAEELEGAVSVGGGSGFGSSEFVAERLGNYICSAGLISEDGNEKPSWNEFKKEISSLS